DGRRGSLWGGQTGGSVAGTGGVDIAIHCGKRFIRKLRNFVRIATCAAMTLARSVADQTRCRAAKERTPRGVRNAARGISAAFTGKRKSLAPFEAARRSYPARLATLRRLASGSQQERRLLDGIETQIQDYIGLWGLPLIEIAQERLETARSVMRNTIGRERID